MRARRKSPRFLTILRSVPRRAPRWRRAQLFTRRREVVVLLTAATPAAALRTPTRPRSAPDGPGRARGRRSFRSAGRAIARRRRAPSLLPVRRYYASEAGGVPSAGERDPK